MPRQQRHAGPRSAISLVRSGIGKKGIYQQAPRWFSPEIAESQVFRELGVRPGGAARFHPQEMALSFCYEEGGVCHLNSDVLFQNLALRSLHQQLTPAMAGMLLGDIPADYRILNQDTLGIDPYVFCRAKCSPRVQPPSQRLFWDRIR